MGAGEAYAGELSVQKQRLNARGDEGEKAEVDEVFRLRAGLRWFRRRTERAVLRTGRTARRCVPLQLNLGCVEWVAELPVKWGRREKTFFELLLSSTGLCGQSLTPSMKPRYSATTRRRSEG